MTPFTFLIALSIMGVVTLFSIGAAVYQKGCSFLLRQQLTAWKDAFEKTEIRLKRELREAVEQADYKDKLNGNQGQSIGKLNRRIDRAIEALSHEA